jgi:thiosulfate/3-mercaptopyruvate sulfurtransferase
MMTDPIGDNEYLTSIETLAGLVSQKAVAVIDTREPDDYAAGHIPGAVNIFEIFTYLATKGNGGYDALRRIFAALFSTAGLGGDERVVVYEDAMDNGYGRSCRGRFILQYLGHKNATVLHGGYQAWLEAGLPVTAEVPAVTPRVFPVKLEPSIMLTAEEMLASLADPSIVKLDVRDRAEWMGISSSPYGPDFAPRKGRIPGAAWIEWYRLMRQDGPIPWFRPPEEMQAIFAEANISADTPVHVYCFKGARTSNVFIALKMAGVKTVRNYFSSWNEWSRDPTLPIEKGHPKVKAQSR